MTVEAKKQTLGFETEVKHLLHLMIHSLYSNKEIFLRELISNASDASDKLRFLALSNESLYEGDSNLKIRLEFDQDQRTIKVIDNGIGMTRAEVQEHIGTIAKSGTKQFFDALTGDQAKDSELIGQFGVGFYSAFIVADKVTLVTRKAGAPASEGVRWESAGEGDYTLESVEKATRGTEITLHLKESESEFLDGYRIRSIVRKFSDHISLPIVMDKEAQPSYDEEGNEEAEKPAAQVEEETVNSASALWTKARQDISEDDYNQFYKHVGHDFQDPLTYVHSKVEGTNEYTLLLYVPSRAPFDLWDRDNKHGVKLYIRKVFITDDAEQLMPRYLRFIKGVIDANSLPLNVSREILQQSKQISTIKSGAVKKVLGMLEGLAKNEPEKYEKFWSEFGAVIKEGPIEDHANKDRIAKLLRFASTHGDGDGDKQAVSLEDYVGRMQEGQEHIYYVTADSYPAAKNSPHLEIFRKKGIEVLLLSDRVDEWLVSSLDEFDGKHLQSVAKGQLDLGKLDDEEEKQHQEEVSKDFESVLTQIKDVLADKVSEVRLSHRLTESPACLVSDVYGMSLNMERIMKEAGQNMSFGKKPIFEINPDHALVLRLKAEQDDTRFADLTHILFDQAILAEGGQLDDPSAFVHKLNGLLQGLLH